MNKENIAIRKDGIKVKTVNKDIYRRLVFDPILFFLVKKYKFELFLNTIIKKTISKITSKIKRTCKLMSEKNNSFGLINAKNVSMHKLIETTESKITVLKPFNLLNIKNINNLYKHNIV